MPDEGTTGWDDAVQGPDRVPERGARGPRARSLGRPPDVQLRLAGRGHGSTGSRTSIRGDDHVSNTPKQIQILQALGSELPIYAHVPNVFGEDGKKLSKRHGAVSVDEFRQAGYMPEALMNFLALLGWAPDGETTIMSRDELIERFSLERVGRERRRRSTTRSSTG